MPIRSGDEPAHARSPLRLRLGLALFGLVWSIGGAIFFFAHGAPVLGIGFSVVALIAVADSFIVTRHIQAGAHWQPGPEIPPYRPADPGPAALRPRRLPIAPGVRLHRYLALMCVCLILIILAWTWVRQFSTGLAVAMSLVAMVIPPIAAIVANVGALEDPARQQRDDAHGTEGTGSTGGQ